MEGIHHIAHWICGCREAVDGYLKKLAIEWIKLEIIL